MPDFDLVVYGGTGFTGRQLAAYIGEFAPADLAWAVAGRSESAVRDIALECGADTAIVADSFDSDSISAMVSRGGVIATTVGPYGRFGTPVVEECVRQRRHYVDITGETSWVRKMARRFHQTAAADGTKIVPFCGFDSVPADIGTFALVRELQAAGVDVVHVEASYRLRGGLNGGTLETMLTSAESGDAAIMADPFLLDPPGFERAATSGESKDVRSIRRDPRTGRWLSPFVMGVINTRVVRRSSALYCLWGESYGDPFGYAEAMESSNWRKAAALTAGLGAVGVVANTAMGRTLLRRLGPAPGEGPSAESIERGRFRVHFRARGANGEEAGADWEFAGDPGNRFTVMALGEAALCLADSDAELPGGKERGGILTPATALGTPYLERLIGRGVEWSCLKA